MNQKTQNMKMSILPNLINRFNTIPIKIPAGIFLEMNKLNLKLIWKYIQSRIAKTASNKKNNVGGLPVSDFKTYKSTVIQTLWY